MKKVTVTIDQKIESNESKISAIDEKLNQLQSKRNALLKANKELSITRDKENLTAIQQAAEQSGLQLNDILSLIQNHKLQKLEPPPVTPKTPIIQNNQNQNKNNNAPWEEPPKP